jgi:phospholipase/carboxylesterase
MSASPEFESLLNAAYSHARLGFRPRPTTGRAGGRDEALGVGAGRDGVLYVPDTAEPRAPVMVFFHGATGSGRAHLRAVLAAADRYGVILVAPDSRLGGTWDLIAAHGFGPDVEFLDRALTAVVERVDADLSLLALGGVSDGASYALSLGLANGDVFSTVIAFSPGFLAVPQPVGKPRVFISHGTADPILPIDGCSGAFVPQLRHAGYEVMFRPFAGGHTVPPEIADQGMRWWLASAAQGETGEAPA